MAGGPTLSRFPWGGIKAKGLIFRFGTGADDVTAAAVRAWAH